MKKIVLLAVAVAVINANQGNETSNNKAKTNVFDYIQQQRNKMGLMLTEMEEKELNLTQKQYEDTLLDTVIYTDIIKFTTNTPISNAKSVAFVTNNVVVYRKKLEEERQKNNQNKTEKETVYYKAVGYCNFANNIEVTASNEFAMLECSFNINAKNQTVYRKGKLFAGLYPDYKREMLIALPIYLKFNNVEYPSKGVILNGQMTSLNVADYVDKIRIRKLLAKSLIVSSDVAYTQSMAYLKALEASKKQEEVIYQNITNPNGTVTTTPITIANYQKPDKKDYWVTGLIELTSRLVNLFGEDYLEYLKPMFKVNQGSVVYANVIFYENDKDLIGTYKELNTKEIEKINTNNEKFEAKKFNINTTLKK